jgi:hypothetical protein
MCGHERAAKSTNHLIATETGSPDLAGMGDGVGAPPGHSFGKPNHN